MSHSPLLQLLPLLLLIMIMRLLRLLRLLLQPPGVGLLLAQEVTSWEDAQPYRIFMTTFLEQWRPGHRNVKYRKGKCFRPCLPPPSIASLYPCRARRTGDSLPCGAVTPRACVTLAGQAWRWA
jgi:hypothetical protein